MSYAGPDYDPGLDLGTLKELQGDALTLTLTLTLIPSRSPHTVRIRVRTLFLTWSLLLFRFRRSGRRLVAG